MLKGNLLFFEICRSDEPNIMNFANLLVLGVLKILFLSGFLRSQSELIYSFVVKNIGKL